MAKPSEKHNTYLPPEDEIAFQKWAGNRIGDTQDYDLRGYYAAVQGRVPVGDAHLPDTYKKPNHPTFSNESQYHGTATGAFGGQWYPTPGGYAFETGPANNNPELGRYFQEVEPDVVLVQKRSAKK